MKKIGQCKIQNIHKCAQIGVLYPTNFGMYIQRCLNLFKMEGGIIEKDIMMSLKYVDMKSVKIYLISNYPRPRGRRV